MNWIQYLFEIAMLEDKPKRRKRITVSTAVLREKARLRMAEVRKKRRENRKKEVEGGIEDKE